MLYMNRKGCLFFFLILFFVCVHTDQQIDDALNKEREELHVVGSCWKSEMVRCLHKCGSVIFCVFSVFMHSYFIHEYNTKTRRDPHRERFTFF